MAIRKLRVSMCLLVCVACGQLHWDFSNIIWHLCICFGKFLEILSTKLSEFVVDDYVSSCTYAQSNRQMQL